MHSSTRPCSAVTRGLRVIASTLCGFVRALVAVDNAGVFSAHGEELSWLVRRCLQLIWSTLLLFVSNLPRILYLYWSVSLGRCLFRGLAGILERILPELLEIALGYRKKLSALSTYAPYYERVLPFARGCGERHYR
ncbi:hypothetical protein Tco_1015567 [Tanacetum coccineum]|uniref:Uncharacterized protein n=1 Tax=Tanacetum coccineum TaxID=301880 RepID=A0ABQ5FNM3_9ASTR